MGKKASVLKKPSSKETTKAPKRKAGDQSREKETKKEQLALEDSKELHGNEKKDENGKEEKEGTEEGAEEEEKAEEDPCVEDKEKEQSLSKSKAKKKKENEEDEKGNKEKRERKEKKGKEKHKDEKVKQKDQKEAKEKEKGKTNTKEKKKKDPKPKAKAKPKAKGSSKKNTPAPHGEEEGQKKQSESLLEKTEKWKKGLCQGSTSSSSSRNPSSSSSRGSSKSSKKAREKRNRGKARKFKKMYDSGAIPDHILDLFEKESKRHPKPREFKSELINKLFKEDGKGGYKMVADNPWFQQQKESFHKKYGKDEQQGTPKDVFVYQVFHGNSEALEAAIEKGSVQQWDQDGVVFCGFRKTKAGVENGKVDKYNMGSGQVKLKGDQWQAMSKAFKSLSWSFSGGGPAGSGEGQASGSSFGPSSKKQKSIESGHLTEQMAQVLTDAKGAQEKLYGTAMKMLNKCADIEDKKNFKTVVLSLKDWSMKNDHVLTFKASLLCAKFCFAVAGKQFLSPTFQV